MMDVEVTVYIVGVFAVALGWAFFVAFDAGAKGEPVDYNDMGLGVQFGLFWPLIGGIGIVYGVLWCVGHGAGYIGRRVGERRRFRLAAQREVDELLAPCAPTGVAKQ